MSILRVVLGGVLGMMAAHGATALIGADAAPAFQSSAQVTFGALYGERAIRATVVSPVPAAVAVHTGRLPRRVFVGGEALAGDAWQYDAGTGVVRLSLPAGTSQLQVRFDDLADLRPRQVTVPVEVVSGGRSSSAGSMEVTVADERAFGILQWAGQEGFYQVRALRGGAAAAGVEVVTQATRRGDAVLLVPGSALTLRGEAPAQVSPVDLLQCRLVGAVTPTRRLDKDSVPWSTSLVLEGEAFTGEGGGAVTRSAEHTGTHGGGCVYAWGTPGHWLSWVVEVPKAGDYSLALVVASQEKVILRSVQLDGEPLAGAGVLRLAGTGGWGRSQAAEWQAMQPVDAGGEPLRFRLSAGRHELRLENALGQHMNLDALLFTPVP